MAVNIRPFIEEAQRSVADLRARRARKKAKRRPLERAVEDKASKQMREDGAEVAKLNLWGQRSWPDRLIAPPGVKVRVRTCWTVEQAMREYELAKRDGVVLLIEYKRKGEELTELQAELQRRLMFGHNLKYSKGR